jgi:hypothetical protein
MPATVHTFQTTCCNNLFVGYCQIYEQQKLFTDYQALKNPFHTKATSGDSYKKRKNTNRKGKDFPKASKIISDSNPTLNAPFMVGILAVNALWIQTDTVSNHQG